MERHPRFTPLALAAGFHSLHALPMRLRGRVIGALNLFRVHEGALDDDDVVAAQAFADIATIAILQHRAAAHAQQVNDELGGALNDRILIEQATGMVAERSCLDMQQAFTRLRTYARNGNLRLVDVASDVISGSLSVDKLDPPAPAATRARR